MSADPSTKWLVLQIALNTNLMYHSDHLSEGKEDPGLQLAFLLEALLMVLDDIFEKVAHGAWK